MDTTRAARINARVAEMRESVESLARRLDEADDAAEANPEKLGTLVWFIGRDIIRLSEDQVELEKLAPPVAS